VIISAHLHRPLHLALLTDRIAICRLAPDALEPARVRGEGSLAIVLTA
jgi:hypothetical protein